MSADETSSLYYFSFVTLTTVGFGDVVPVAGGVRTLAVVEALIGQIVLVSLVARLVGIQVSTASQDPSCPGGAAPSGGSSGRSGSRTCAEWSADG